MNSAVTYPFFVSFGFVVKCQLVVGERMVKRGCMGGKGMMVGRGVYGYADLFWRGRERRRSDLGYMMCLSTVWVGMVLVSMVSLLTGLSYNII